MGAVSPHLTLDLNSGDGIVRFFSAAAAAVSICPISGDRSLALSWLKDQLLSPWNPPSSSSPSCLHTIGRGQSGSSLAPPRDMVAAVRIDAATLALQLLSRSPAPTTMVPALSSSPYHSSPLHLHLIHVATAAAVDPWRDGVGCACLYVQWTVLVYSSFAYLLPFFQFLVI